MYDISEFKLPYKVSLLYSLVPEKQNTGLQEGVLSYITRLSSAHHVCFGDLLKVVIAPELQKEYIQKDISRGGSRFYQRASTLNGVGLHSRTIVQILIKLTTVNTLENLTLLPWQDVISEKYLLKSSKSWCPHCYNQWKEAGEILYEPLLWSIKLISVCPIHNSPLIMRCPNQYCRKIISHLSKNSLIGFCPHCSTWLGKNKDHQIILNEDNNQLRNSLSLFQLISHTNKIQRNSICRKNIQDSFQVLLSYSQGNISRLANLFSMNRCTVWQYCNGTFIPPLPTILEICNHLNIDLIEFLLGKISHLNIDFTYQMPPLKRFCANKISNDTSANDKLIYYATITPPLSLTEVAKKLNYTTKTTKKNYPILAEKIKNRYMEFKNSTKIMTYKKTCEDIERAVLSLNESGHYPSKRNVERVLQRKGILQRPAYKNIWRTMKQKQVYKEINTKPT